MNARTLQFVALIAIVAACEAANGPFQIPADATPPTPDAVSSDAGLSDAEQPAIADSTRPDAVTTDAVPQTDAAPPPRTCHVDDDCADGLDCTVDTCAPTAAGGAHCAWTLVADTCLIAAVCRPPGEAHPLDPCRICDPATPVEWASVPDEMPCDDRDACTSATTCRGGACVGEAVICDDGLECTADVCDAVAGCVFPPVADGARCGDEDACTDAELCLDGVCVGATVDCDDRDPCTDDTCDAEAGCSHAFNAGPCEDGDPCTVDDQCVAGACTAGPPNSCDDFNGCTIDLCGPEIGCHRLPTQSPCCIGVDSVCYDGDPCTVDACDAETGACSYPFSEAPCDDGDACTIGDICAEGICGGADRDCTGDDPCLSYACDSEDGCFTTALDGGECDDGLECTAGDTCVAGICTGDIAGCYCTPDFADATKLTQIAIGLDADADQALDIDGDGEPDNALGVLSAFVNPSLADSVAAGIALILLDFQNLDGAAAAVSVYNGELAPHNAGCNLQAAACQYIADPISVREEPCGPQVSLPAAVAGDVITAGGPDLVMPFDLPLTADSVLRLTVYNVQMRLTMTRGEDGNVTAVTGLLGGAIPAAELDAAIEAIPAEQFEELGITPEGVRQLLGAIAPNDLDTDGDGNFDARSIGIRVTGIDGELIGVAR